ncbi:THO complex subunit 7B [Hordeum vulgare]|nr:THO complex subunit 7B [Hordeum vulgare]
MAGPTFEVSDEEQAAGVHRGLQQRAEHQAVVDANLREKESFNELQVEIQRQILQAQTDIEDLKKQLEQSKIERQHKEECEAIRKLISSQPPRSETEKLIANLEKEISNLEAQSAACTRTLELRKKQFALLLHVNHGAAAPAIYTVHFHLELGARPGKSTAKYCNNTISGNGCHLGVEQ